ncbi:sortase [Prauserella marina]|uniref:Sortase family protein n=1 Tax=Prauserella marina TaxID=530584 RepID=A0A222VW06_9PSEU|nr:class F sortase [Prauserella marina]ASR38012.1 sortase [Prauserella marina]PWV73245.1 sortase family protein [Prauserella marina]SDD68324.1 Sortase family protein [Prauserella marina]
MSATKSTEGGQPGRTRAYLLGVGSVLAVELAVLGFVLAPTTAVIAGVAAPMHTAAADTAETAPRAAPPAPREQPPAATTTEKPAAPATAPSTPAQPRTEVPVSSGQRPGTIALPDGGTARLVREEVGADAVLPVPDDLGEATWWGAGLDAPSGASVFAGHVNWHGQTGPFAELWDIRVDEPITVTDAEGTTWRYRVSQIITLHKDELPARSAELFGQSGPHRIVLVTCGGRWLGGNTGYAENRVVVAEPA